MTALEINVARLGQVEVLPLATGLGSRADDGLPPGVAREDRVLFLDAGRSSTSVLHSAGRAGRILRAGGAAGEFWYNCEAGAAGTDGHHRLALLNPPVVLGDEVVILRQADMGYWNQPRIGHRAQVVAVTARDLTVDDITPADRRTGIRITHWTRALAPGAPAGVAAAVPGQSAVEAIPELPEYWEQRIRTIANTYGRRHSLCSVLNEALEELFSVNRRWRVLSNSGAPGTVSIRNPEGREIATFTDPTAAAEFVALKNQSLPRAA